jgi:hypothetical protein
MCNISEVQRAHLDIVTGLHAYRKLSLGHQFGAEITLFDDAL